MPVPLSSKSLKETLFAAYDGFANKTYKNLDKYSKFIADDRTDGDVGSDRQLFASFCSIFVDVVASDRVSITLYGGIPQGPAVKQWLQSNGVKSSKVPRGEHVVFDVTPVNVGSLLTLASAMASITAPGASYPVKAYKYSAPRTAKSLRRLNGVLDKHWKAI